jgi:hypothetical protein
MRAVTSILYSLCDRIAVRRAERAKRHWQPAEGIRKDIKGPSPLAGRSTATGTTTPHSFARTCTARLAIDFDAARNL